LPVNGHTWSTARGVSFPDCFFECRDKFTNTVLMAIARYRSLLSELLEPV
jgi:hypothetical protein